MATSKPDTSKPDTSKPDTSKDAKAPATTTEPEAPAPAATTEPEAKAEPAPAPAPKPAKPPAPPPPTERYLFRARKDLHPGSYLAKYLPPSLRQFSCRAGELFAPELPENKWMAEYIGDPTVGNPHLFELKKFPPTARSTAEWNAAAGK